MMTLSLLFCLSTHPDHCRTLEYPGVPPMACVASWQTTAVEWLNAHPKWQLMRAVCGPDKGRAL